MPKQKPRELEDDRPRVNLTGSPPDQVLDEVLMALNKKTVDSQVEMYRAGGELLQLDTTEPTPTLRRMTDGALDTVVHRNVLFVRSGRDGDLPTVLPARYLAQIRSQHHHFARRVVGVVETPVFRPDGTLVSYPGYDQATSLIYWPAGGFANEHLFQPGKTDRESAHAAALELIGDRPRGLVGPLVDFPFVDDASRANMLGLILTPFIRPMLGDGNVPMALLDAPTAGTGKTWLANIFSMVTTGRPAATISMPESEPEMRKAITSYLVSGFTVIVIDNVFGRVQSAPLEQILTTRRMRDRVLGRTEAIDVENAATWMLTGNNLRPAGDMVRRVYLVRIDSHEERPFERTEFLIPDLGRYLVEERPRLVQAALTMVKSWVEAGRPAAHGTPVMGSFESWCRTVGGILEWAGIPGFLKNLGDLRDSMDSDTDELAVFLRALQTHTAGEPFVVRDLAAELVRLHEEGRGTRMLSSSSLVEVYDALPAKIIKDGRNVPGDVARALGQYLGYRKDRPAGGLRIEPSRMRGDRIETWVVARVHTSESMQGGMYREKTAENDMKTPF